MTQHFRALTSELPALKYVSCAVLATIVSNQNPHILKIRQRFQQSTRNEIRPTLTLAFPFVTAQTITGFSSVRPTTPLRRWFAYDGFRNSIHGYCDSRKELVYLLFYALKGGLSYNKLHARPRWQTCADSVVLGVQVERSSWAFKVQLSAALRGPNAHQKLQWHVSATTPAPDLI